MKRFLIILALAVLPFSVFADELTLLEKQCRETYGGLVTRQTIKKLPVLEMVVVSDFESPNVALNPNIAHNVVDLSVNQRTAYVQTLDGSRGLKLLFTKGEYNRLKLYDKVVLDLNGCKVGKVDGTDAMYVTGLTPLNIVKVTNGTENDVPVKEKCISQLTDRDLFTRITLKDMEFVFTDGAITNIAEFYGQYVPELHSVYKDKMISNCDGSCCIMRDSQGNGIYMAVNTLCAWRREAPPKGIGSVSGVLVMERNRRYGDKDAKYYIRPLFREDIAISSKKKNSLWKRLLGWFPESIHGVNLDFEKAGFAPEGNKDRVISTTGQKAYLSYDRGNAKLRKAGTFNSLLCRDGSGNVVNGSIKTYGALNQWYVWNDKGEAVGSKSIFIEFSTEKLKAEQIQFAFDIVGSDADLLSCRGLPLRWKVEYAVNDGSFIPLNEVDGTETFGLRPMPAAPKFDKKYNHTYQMMYDHGLGLQQHLYLLPKEVIGKERVVIRISPAVDRYFHLSKDPAKTVEIPVVHDKVKSNNKANATFRLGSVFIDYK